MDPVLAIVWIGVAVFAATAVITLLYVVGFATRIQKEHGQLLFRLLVTEIVVASVAAFTYYIQSNVRHITPNRLPVSGLMVLEQGPTIVVTDDGQSLYVRSPDVSLAGRVVDLQLDLRPDWSSSKVVSFEAGVPKTVSVGVRKYRVGFSQMGVIDADPKEKQGKHWDFALLSISREN